MFNVGSLAYYGHANSAHLVGSRIHSTHIRTVIDFAIFFSSSVVDDNRGTYTVSLTQ